MYEVHFELKLTWHVLRSNVRHAYKMTRHAGSLQFTEDTAEKKVQLIFLAVVSLSNRLTPILLTPGLLEPFGYWASTHMETN